MARHFDELSARMQACVRVTLQDIEASLGLRLCAQHRREVSRHLAHLCFRWLDSIDELCVADDEDEAAPQAIDAPPAGSA